MREQPVQHGDDESGGVFGGKRAGRKGRNHNRPCDRRPPDLEPAHSTRTRPDAPAREFLPLNAALFEPVIRGFSRDDHVVNVAFAQACDCHPQEFRTLLQIGNGGAAEISHSGPETAD